MIPGDWLPGTRRIGGPMVARRLPAGANAVEPKTNIFGVIRRIVFLAQCCTYLKPNLSLRGFLANFCSWDWLLHRWPRGVVQHDMCLSGLQWCMFYQGYISVCLKGCVMASLQGCTCVCPSTGYMRVCPEGLHWRLFSRAAWLWLSRLLSLASVFFLSSCGCY